MKLKQNKNPRSVEYQPRGAEKLFNLSSQLHKKGFRRLSKITKRINQFLFNVNIYPEVRIGKGLQLPHGGFGVVIHHNTVIGDDAIIFHGVTIANGGARIGDRVYIGTGAVLVGSITIGNDVTIGANAVVNFDVPDKALVVGQKSQIKRDEQ